MLLGGSFTAAVLLGAVLLGCSVTAAVLLGGSVTTAVLLGDSVTFCQTSKVSQPCHNITNGSDREHLEEDLAPAFSFLLLLEWDEVNSHHVRIQA